MFEGKVAVITGASRGIGRAIALAWQGGERTWCLQPGTKSTFWLGPGRWRAWAGGPLWWPGTYAVRKRWKTSARQP